MIIRRRWLQRPINVRPLPGHLEQFFEMLLAERGAAKNTIEAYRRDLVAVTEYLRPQALDTITSVRLTDYLSSIAEGGNL